MIIPNLANMATMARLGSGGGGGVLQNENFTMQMSAQSLNPVDATTYRMRNGLITTSSDTNIRMQVPRKCTIRKIYMRLRNGGNGSSENSTIQILVNGTTSYVVSAVVDNSANLAVINTNLDIPVNRGDYISIRWITPTWVTNPTGILSNAVLRCVPPQGAKGSYLLQGSPGSLNPASGSNNHIADGMASATTATIRQYVPSTGIITGAQIYAFCGVPGSNEQFSYLIRVNDATVGTITSTAKLDAVDNSFSNLGLSIPVNAGDYINIRFTAPTRATPPTAVIHRFNLVIRET